MQPYFFPYLGYFVLIKNTDRFILLDEVQFIRHGWIERNRIIKQNSDWLYFKVPLIKESSRTLIKDIRIDNAANWKRTAIDQLVVYKRNAPNYFSVIKLIKSIFENEYNDIVTLNYSVLKGVCEYLNIETDIQVFSKMNLSIEAPSEPDDWALNICKSLGNIKEYWNPPGGKEFFDPKKYERANIALKFIQPKIDEYDQKRQPFIPGLSIIDVLMFNSVETIHLMLNKYEEI